MSRVQAVVVRKHPVVHGAHDVAYLMSHIIDEAREIEIEAEAVGMTIYQIAPPVGRLDEEAMDLG